MKLHYYFIFCACIMLISCNSTSDTLIHVETISLNKASTTLYRGSNETLIATLTPDNAPVKDVEWASSDSNIVTVSNEGVLTGVNAGNAVITVTSKDSGISASCSVNVITAVSAVSLNKASTTLYRGSNETLIATLTPDNATVKDVEWASSDSNIVTVSNEGVLTGVNAGNAVITVTSKDSGISASCSVVVNLKILFLGNSITKHGPSPSIGWYGDWGMAATSEDKDYVHVLISELKIINKNIEYKVQNIASW